jgi:hypothetical protein
MIAWVSMGTTLREWLLRRRRGVLEKVGELVLSNQRSAVPAAAPRQTHTDSSITPAHSLTR